VQFGYADENRNQLAYYWGAGLRYVGLIPGRERDEVGVAVASAWNGSEFVRFSEDVQMTPVERTETVIEAAYRAEIAAGLIVQPDLQYVINPSMDPEIDNALQVGLRLEISF
jgi:porin